MKRICFIFLLLFVCISLCGQTRYYKYVETINADGSKSKFNDHGKYITFTNNGAYESDENGYRKKLESNTYGSSGVDDRTFINQGMENDIRVYFCGVTEQTYYYWYFSADYSRLNEKAKLRFLPDVDGIIQVYQLSDPPGKTNAPLQLY